MVMRGRCSCRHDPFSISFDGRPLQALKAKLTYMATFVRTQVSNLYSMADGAIVVRVLCIAGPLATSIARTS